MAEPTQLDVLITVEANARPIQGWMDVAGCSRGRFHGWLELNDRLEQALSSSGSAPHCGPSPATTERP